METLTLKNLTDLLNKPGVTDISVKRNVTLRKVAAGTIFLFADIISLACAFSFALLASNFLSLSSIDMARHLFYMPFIISMFIMAFYLRGLYPGFGIDVVEELKTLTYSITIVFALVATLSYLIKGAWDYSRVVFLLSWFISIPLVPLGRSFIKKSFGDKNWWGIPVVIIGAGDTGEKVINSLHKHKYLGLRPVVAVDDDADKWGYFEDVPVIGGVNVLPELSQKLGIDHAIIAIQNIPRKKLQEWIQDYNKYFPHLLVISDIFGLSSLWVASRDLGGILGLEVQNKLLKRSSKFKKRIFDIILASALSLIALPLISIISICIWLDSKGKIFFKQLRMGINDSRFNIIKFRTMHLDAEKRLNELLKHNPELKAEYEIYHKMKNDPRLTQVGKFLRKFSFDELPQFINVIKGEMSLIGPRAYMPWEKVKMNGHQEIILKVKPGISGLWQVTDRNQSSFEERNLTDVYYISNWSMFLDFYIVARTISVIFLGRGS